MVNLYYIYQGVRGVMIKEDNKLIPTHQLNPGSAPAYLLYMYLSMDGYTR